MAELFDAAAHEVYDRILTAVSKFGAFRLEEKKTCVHLCARSAFAGVHPRKAAVLLNIRSDAPINSPRIRKSEQVSANRFHNEILVETPKAINRELIGWLKAAYTLGANGKD